MMVPPEAEAIESRLVYMVVNFVGTVWVMVRIPSVETVRL